MATTRTGGAPLFLSGWFLVGVALTLGVSQVGLLTVPLGVVLIALLARRSRAPELRGIPIGAGAVGALIGASNLDHRPCPSSGTLVVSPGQAEMSCGGFDGLPWLVAGVLMMLSGLVVYAILLVRTSRRHEGRSGTGELGAQ